MSEVLQALGWWFLAALIVSPVIGIMLSKIEQEERERELDQ